MWRRIGIEEEQAEEEEEQAEQEMALEAVVSFVWSLIKIPLKSVGP